MNKIVYFSMVVALLVFPSTVSAQGRNRFGDSTLRQGTSVRVRFPDNFDSDRNRNGDQFQGILDRDLVSNGSVLARAGSPVYFRLVDVQAGRSSNSRSRVALTLTGIGVESSIVPIETNTLTVGTAPRRNQKLNFIVARNSAFDARADSGRQYGRDDDRMRRGRDRNYDMRDAGHGSFHWRGRVDGSDFIELRGDRVTVRHRQAQPITEASYNVTSPLPRQLVTVQLNKIRGRGNVMLTQPSSSNNYTAIVYIEDNDGGSDYYEFELSW